MRRCLSGMLGLALCLAAPSARAGEALANSVEYAAYFGLWQAALSDPEAGGDADLAHSFATARMTDGADALQIERVLDVAVLWLRWDRSGIPAPVAEAGISAERARAMLCYVSGEGPGPADDLITEWGLPKANPDTCDFDLAALMDRADAILTVEPEPGNTVRLDLAQASAPWKRWLSAAGVLQKVAAQARTLPKLGPAILAVRPCGRAGIVINRDERSLILCTELLDAMARAAGEEP